MFKVQSRPCATCIYRLESPLDLAKLEAAITDPNMPGHFISYRICHHSDDVCCAGFWARHADAFNLGQLAQRVGMVNFVEVDMLKKEK